MINIHPHNHFPATSHLTAMKNLMDEFLLAGLTRDEAGKAIEVVYEWMRTHYPVMAAMARTTMLKEIPLETRNEDGIPGTEQ